MSPSMKSRNRILTRRIKANLIVMFISWWTSSLVAVAAVVDLVSGRQKPAWFHALSYTLAVVLSLLNVLAHSRDGYTAVVPTGLTLSAIVVAILVLFTFGAGWSLTRDRGAR